MESKTMKSAVVQTWKVVEEMPDGTDVVLEAGLSQQAAEELLCRACNEGCNAFLMEDGTVQ